MIIHLAPGSGTVELHIHDDAQVYLHQPIVPVEAPASTVASAGLPARRTLLLGSLGALCLVIGIMAFRPSPLPAPPSGLPPRPVAVAPSVPFPTAPPGDNIPPAVAQQLAQPPVVMAPRSGAQPASPQPAQGGSAFGLEN